jgi:hypothetical protein
MMVMVGVVAVGLSTTVVVVVYFVWLKNVTHAFERLPSMEPLVA